MREGLFQHFRMANYIVRQSSTSRRKLYCPRDNVFQPMVYHYTGTQKAQVREEKPHIKFLSFRYQRVCVKIHFLTYCTQNVREYFKNV